LWFTIVVISCEWQAVPSCRWEANRDVVERGKGMYFD